MVARPMSKSFRFALAALLLASAALLAQQHATLTVDAAHPGPFTSRP